MDSPKTINLPWYKQWWGATIIIVGGLGLVLVMVLGTMMVKFLIQIKQGKTPDFVIEQNKLKAPDAALLARREKLESKEAPFAGKAGAPITIVEFVDLKCPNSQAEWPVLQKLLAKYPEKIKLMTRQFPVESLYPGTTFWSQAAWCAQTQGRYWQWQEVMFANQTQLTTEPIVDDVYGWAEAAGLDRERLDACIAGPQALQRVKADYFLGVEMGVRGTPTFFVNGEKVEGAIPMERWEKVLNKVNN